MKTQTKFRQFIWLLDTIQRAGRITLEEINRRWLNSEMSEGVELSRRTFIRHRNAIEEMFGIFIDCDRSDGFRYFIGNPEDLQTANLQRWMVNSISTSSLLAESKDLKDQILLEDIPSGQFHLEPILKAMRNHQLLCMTYERFGTGEPYTIDVEPYCVKLHHQRWYMVVRNPQSKHKNLTTYALDRIKQLEIIEDSHFDLPKDFDATTFFMNYFGVYVNDEYQPERIVIRAFGNQPDYFRTLPLHPTQKELTSGVSDSESYTDFEYHMAITYDLVSELLSKNSWIEVMAPESLREEMRRQISEMERRYRKV